MDRDLSIMQGKYRKEACKRADGSGGNNVWEPLSYLVIGMGCWQRHGLELPLKQRAATRAATTKLQEQGGEETAVCTHQLILSHLV